MVRGGSKLVGRGRRGNAAAEEVPTPDMGWQPEMAGAGAAPSPARNILPGEPFVPLAPATPAQRGAAEGNAGWGMPDGALPWGGGVDPITAPMHAMPNGAPGSDPLDALQQYAGLPLGSAGMPAAPPDPNQVFSPTAPAYSGPPSSSGFAEGGIFTGNESFDGIPDAAPAYAPTTGYEAPGGGQQFDLAGQQQAPTTGPDSQPTETQLFLSAPFAEPVGSYGGPAAPPAFPFGAGAGQPLDVSSLHELAGPPPVFADDDEDGGSRRGRRRRRGSRRGDAVDTGPGSPADGPLLSEDRPPRSGGPRRAVALLAGLAVLGTAGFLGYSQLSGSDTSGGTAGAATSAPTTVRPKFTPPANLSMFAQVSPAQATQLAANYKAISSTAQSDLPAPTLVTGYQPAGTTNPTVLVVQYAAAGADDDDRYQQLVGQLSRPAPGNSTVAARPIAPGAAGGEMLCGAQTGGAAPTAWCSWKSGKGYGFLRTSGTGDSSFAGTFVRELRAYAER